jgi:quercetin dioxygenase-like cupin family protein
MHVAPSDLRTVRQGGLVVRFAMLGSMAYALAEIPAGGSAGSSMEQPCSRPHWGFVIEGDLTFVSDGGRRQTIPAGRAFHVPAGGPEHHFETAGPALIAGFEPVEPDIDVSDRQLQAQGFELVTEDDAEAGVVVPIVETRELGVGRIDPKSWAMSGYRLTRVRMGERSGYTTSWCDVPHWGIVTAGRLAIEWEDDVEILQTGDVFHCPAGPPGHRLEAADPATIVDLTPIAALSTAGRVADWRRGPDPAQPARPWGIAVAALG